MSGLPANNDLILRLEQIANGATDPVPEPDPLEVQIAQLEAAADMATVGADEAELLIQKFRETPVPVIGGRPAADIKAGDRVPALDADRPLRGAAGPGSGSFVRHDESLVPKTRPATLGPSTLRYPQPPEVSQYVDQLVEQGILTQEVANTVKAKDEFSADAGEKAIRGQAKAFRKVEEAIQDPRMRLRELPLRGLSYTERAAKPLEGQPSPAEYLTHATFAKRQTQSPQQVGEYGNVESAGEEFVRTKVPLGSAIAESARMQRRIGQPPEGWSEFNKYGMSPEQRSQLRRSYAADQRTPEQIAEEDTPAKVRYERIAKALETGNPNHMTELDVQFWADEQYRLEQAADFVNSLMTIPEGQQGEGMSRTKAETIVMITDGLAVMPANLLEFWLTGAAAGGIGTLIRSGALGARAAKAADIVARGTASRAIGIGTRQAVAKVVPWTRAANSAGYAAKQLSELAIGQGVRAGVQTAINPDALVEQGQAGVSVPLISPEQLLEAEESVVKSIRDAEEEGPNGYLATFIENLSERVGGTAGKLLSPVVARTIARNRLGKWAVRTMSQGGAGKLKEIGWDGVLAEMFEERVSDLGRYVAGLENDPGAMNQLIGNPGFALLSNDDKWNEIRRKAGQQFVAEVLTFAPLTGMQQIASIGDTQDLPPDMRPGVPFGGIGGPAVASDREAYGQQAPQPAGERRPAPSVGDQQPVEVTRETAPEILREVTSILPEGTRLYQYKPMQEGGGDSVVAQLPTGASLVFNMSAKAQTLRDDLEARAKADGLVAADVQKQVAAEVDRLVRGEYAKDPETINLQQQARKTIDEVAAANPQRFSSEAAKEQAAQTLFRELFLQRPVEGVTAPSIKVKDAKGRDVTAGVVVALGNLASLDSARDPARRSQIVNEEVIHAARMLAKAGLARDLFSDKAIAQVLKDEFGSNWRSVDSARLERFLGSLTPEAASGRLRNARGLRNIAKAIRTRLHEVMVGVGRMLRILPSKKSPNYKPLTKREKAIAIRSAIANALAISRGEASRSAADMFAPDLSAKQWQSVARSVGETIGASEKNIQLREAPKPAAQADKPQPEATKPPPAAPGPQPATEKPAPEKKEAGEKPAEKQGPAEKPGDKTEKPVEQKAPAEKPGPAAAPPSDKPDVVTDDDILAALERGSKPQDKPPQAPAGGDSGTAETASTEGMTEDDILEAVGRGAGTQGGSGETAEATPELVTPSTMRKPRKPPTPTKGPSAGPPPAPPKPTAAPGGSPEVDSVLDWLDTNVKGSSFSLGKAPKAKRRVATFFSGIGTMEAALAGIDPAMVVEYDPDTVAEYNRSHGTKFAERSVYDIDPAEVAKSGAVLFHASPECKEFSLANKDRSPGDKDLRSAKAVAAVIRESRPRIVTVENVPRYRNTGLFKLITNALDEQGYNYRIIEADAANLGAPQRRIRLLVQAVREGDLPPLPTTKTPGDWFEAVKDLIDEAPEDAIPPWEQQRLDAMFARGSLDKNQPLITMGGSVDSVVPSAANAGGPAPTLKAGNQVPRIRLADGRVVRVTPRMMARLMSLPDTFAVPERPRLASRVLGNGMQGEFTKAYIQPLLDGVAEEDLPRYSLGSKSINERELTTKILESMGAGLRKSNSPARTFTAFASSIASGMRQRGGYDDDLIERVVKVIHRAYVLVADRGMQFADETGANYTPPRPTEDDLRQVVSVATRPGPRPPEAESQPSDKPPKPAYTDSPQVIADYLRKVHQIDVSRGRGEWVVSSTKPRDQQQRHIDELLDLKIQVKGRNLVRPRTRRSPQPTLVAYDNPSVAILRRLDKREAAARDSGDVASQPEVGGDNGRSRSIGRDTRIGDDAYRSRVPADIRELIESGENIPDDVKSEQIVDIGMAIVAMENGRRGFVVANGTGTGKTFVLGGIASYARSQGKKVVWVTVSQELISQARTKDLVNYPGMNTVEFRTYAAIQVAYATEYDRIKDRNPDLDKDQVSLLASKAVRQGMFANADVVLFDESQHIRNQSANAGNVAMALLSDVPFAVAASATPAEHPMHYKFMAPLGIFDEETLQVGNDIHKGFVAWTVMFGAQLRSMRVRNSDGTEQYVARSEWVPTAKALEAASQVKLWFQHRGMLTYRPSKIPADQVRVEFLDAPPDDRWKVLQDDVEKVYKAAKSLLAAQQKAGGSPEFGGMSGGELKSEAGKLAPHRINQLKRIVEASKYSGAVAWAKGKVEAGRNALVFVGAKTKIHVGMARYGKTYRNKNRSMSSEDKAKYWSASEIMEMMGRWFELSFQVRNSDPQGYGKWRASNPPPFAPFIYALAKSAKQLGVDRADSTAYTEFEDAFGEDVAWVSGDLTPGQVASAVADWRAGKGPRILVATIDKLGTGYSLHAVDPSAPQQSMLMATLPWTPTTISQAMGRIARYGMPEKNVAEIDFLFRTGNPIEEGLRTKIGTRLRAMNLTVSGNDSVVGVDITDLDKKLGDQPVGVPSTVADMLTPRQVHATLRAFAAMYVTENPQASYDKAMANAAARIVLSAEAAQGLYEQLVETAASAAYEDGGEGDEANPEAGDVASVLEMKIKYFLDARGPETMRSAIKQYLEVPRSNDAVYGETFAQSLWPPMAGTIRVPTDEELDQMFGVSPQEQEVAEPGPETTEPATKDRAGSDIVLGSVTQIEMGGGRYMQGRYALIEAGSGQPSHRRFKTDEGTSFEANPAYSKAMGESQYREYNPLDPAGQANYNKVTRFVGDLKTNPSAVFYFVGASPQRGEGPPVVTSEGRYAITGNGRLMSLQIAYEEMDALTLKRRIAAAVGMISLFGISSDAVMAMDRPVLVRVVDVVPGSQQSVELAADQTTQQQEGIYREAAKMGRFIGEEFLDAFENAGDMTLEQFLRDTKAGRDLSISIGSNPMFRASRDRFLTTGENPRATDELIAHIRAVMETRVYSVETIERSSLTHPSLARVAKRAVVELMRIRTFGTTESEQLIRAVDNVVAFLAFSKRSDYENAAGESVRDKFIDVLRYRRRQRQLFSTKQDSGSDPAATVVFTPMEAAIMNAILHSLGAPTGFAKSLRALINAYAEQTTARARTKTKALPGMDAIATPVASIEDLVLSRVQPMDESGKPILHTESAGFVSPKLSPSDLASGEPLSSAKLERLAEDATRGTGSHESQGPSYSLGVAEDSGLGNRRAMDAVRRVLLPLMLGKATVSQSGRKDFGDTVAAAHALWRILGGENGPMKLVGGKDARGLHHVWLADKTTGRVLDPMASQYVNDADVPEYQSGTAEQVASGPAKGRVAEILRDVRLGESRRPSIVQVGTNPVFENMYRYRTKSGATGPVVMHASASAADTSPSAIAARIRRDKPDVVAVDVRGRGGESSLKPVIDALTQGGYTHEVAEYDSLDFGSSVASAVTIVRATRLGALPPISSMTGPTSWADAVGEADGEGHRIDPASIDMIEAPPELKKVLGEVMFRPGTGHVWVGGRPGQYRLATDDRPAPEILPGDPLPMIVFPDGSVGRVRPELLLRLYSILPRSVAVRRVRNGGGHDIGQLADANKVVGFVSGSPTGQVFRAVIEPLISEAEAGTGAALWAWTLNGEPVGTAMANNATDAVRLLGPAGHSYGLAVYQAGHWRSVERPMDAEDGPRYSLGKDVTGTIRVAASLADEFHAAKREVIKKYNKYLSNEKLFFSKVWRPLLEMTNTQAAKSSDGLAKAADNAVADILDFWKNNSHLAEYYGTDWKASIAMLEAYYGRPLTTDESLLYKVLCGVLSPGTQLSVNINEAVVMFDYWMRNGNFDAFELVKNEATGQYRVGDAPFSLAGPTKPTKVRAAKDMLVLAKRYGSIANAVRELETPVTMRELEEFKRELGFSRLSKVPMIRRVVREATGQEEMFPRAFMWGPKVGAYTMNALGHSNFTTVDVWESRWARSYIAGMFKKNYGLPANDEEHDLFVEFGLAFNAKFREEVGVDLAPSALQALRWYYILETIGDVGYTRAKTSETISEYTARGIKRLGQKPGKRNAQRAGGEGRELGDAESRQRRSGQKIGPGNIRQVATGPDGGVGQYSQGQTASPEFRRWFGSSRVVNENGLPLVVYRGEHGTPPDQGVQSLLPSVAFTDDPGAASLYAISPNVSGMVPERPRVIPAYLKIENPVIENRQDPFTDFGEIADKMGSEYSLSLARRFSDSIEQTGVWEDEFADQYDSVDDLIEKNPSEIWGLYVDSYQLLDDSEFVQKAASAGYDGAIHVGNGDTSDALEFRVFDSRQIKSAIGNRGTFDASNPDTRYSLGKAPRQARGDNSIAVAMEMSGASQDAILEATRWFRGPDGLWRHEADSAAMKPSDLGRPTILADAIEYPALFDAYPHLRTASMATYAVDANAEEVGVYLPATHEFAITARTPQRRMELLASAINQATRSIEGLDPAASMGAMLTGDPAETVLIELESEVMRRRARMTEDERNTEKPWATFAKVARELESPWQLSSQQINHRKAMAVELTKTLSEQGWSDARDRQEWLRSMDKRDPIYPYIDLPVPVTDDEVLMRASGKVRSEWRTPSKSLPDGEAVQLRLDIPSYTDQQMWIVTVHWGSGGRKNKVIGYEPSARIVNAQFPGIGNWTQGLDGTWNRVADPQERRALRVVKGGAKSPFAMIRGSWAPPRGEDMAALAKSAMDAATDPNVPFDQRTWAQVGFNPRRHAYYFDRGDMAGRYAIISASEVIQVGGLVLAKDPVRIDTWSPEFARDSLEAARTDAVDTYYAQHAINDYAPLYSLGKAPRTETLTEKLRRMKREFIDGQNVSQAERQGPSTAPPFRDAATEAMFTGARGLRSVSLLKSMYELLMVIPRLGRTNYYIPEGLFSTTAARRYAAAREGAQEMRSINRKAEEFSQNWLTIVLRSIESLPQADRIVAFDAFERLMVYRNLEYTTDPAKTGQTWFNTATGAMVGHSEATQALADLEAYILTLRPEIQTAITDALEAREKLRVELVNRAVAANVPGLSLDSQKNDAYYHQQVHAAIGILGAENAAARIARQRSVMRRPSATISRQARYEGATFNTNLIEAEHAWVRELYGHTLTQEALQKWFVGPYDVSQEVETLVEDTNHNTACVAIADPTINPNNAEKMVVEARDLSRNYYDAVRDFGMGSPQVDAARRDIQAWLSGTDRAAQAASSRMSQMIKILAAWKTDHDPLAGYHRRLASNSRWMQANYPQYFTLTTPLAKSQFAREMAMHMYAAYQTYGNMADERAATRLLWMSTLSQHRRRASIAVIEASNATPGRTALPVYTVDDALASPDYEGYRQVSIGPDQVFHPMIGIAEADPNHAATKIEMATLQGNIPEQMRDLLVVGQAPQLILPGPLADHFESMKSPRTMTPVWAALSFANMRLWEPMYRMTARYLLNVVSFIKNNMGNAFGDFQLLASAAGSFRPYVPLSGSVEATRVLEEAADLIARANPVLHEETDPLIRLLNDRNVIRSGQYSELNAPTDINKLAAYQRVLAEDQNTWTAYLSSIFNSADHFGGALADLAKAAASVWPGKVLDVLGDSRWMNDRMRAIAARIEAKHGRDTALSNALKATAKLVVYGEQREAVFRTAAFLIIRRKLAEHNGQLPYSLSNADAIEELYSNPEFGPDYAAAKAARELLGDYSSISIFCRGMRKFVPFAAWPDVTIGRYSKLARNAVVDIAAGEYQSAAEAVYRGPILQYVPLYVWNQVLVGYVQALLTGDDGDDDPATFSWRNVRQPLDSLSAADKERPIVILPFRINGKQALIRNISAFNDAIILSGFSQAQGTYEKALKGQIGAGEAAFLMAGSPLWAFHERTVGGLHPIFKTIGIPGMPKQSPIYDLVRGILGKGDGLTIPLDATSDTAYQRPAAEIIFRNFGLENQYLYMRNFVSPGGRLRPRDEWLASFFVGLADPAINAMGEMHDAINQFSSRKGDFVESINPVSEYRDMRASAIAGDYETFMAGYAKIAETDPDRGYRSFLQHLARLNPVSRVPKDEREEFLAQLTEEQKRKYEISTAFTEDLRERMWLWFREAAKKDTTPRGAEIRREMDRSLFAKLESLATPRGVQVTPSMRMRARQEGVSVASERQRILDERNQARDNAAAFFRSVLPDNLRASAAELAGVSESEVRRLLRENVPDPMRRQAILQAWRRAVQSRGSKAVP